MNKIAAPTTETSSLILIIFQTTHDHTCGVIMVQKIETMGPKIVKYNLKSELLYATTTKYKTMAHMDG